jgi:hypothetical protein
MGLGYIKKQVNKANREELHPIMQHALADYKYHVHMHGRALSEEEEEAFKKKLLTEQIRCQVMTKDSIGEERKKRALITFAGTSIGAVFICLLALIIAPAAAPFLLGLIIAAGIQYALNVSTIKESRNDRLKGAANSVVAMQIKADDDKALEEVKKTKEAEAVNAKGGAGKDEGKASFVQRLKKGPVLSKNLEKLRDRTSVSNEKALPIPAFYGISNAEKFGRAAAARVAQAM